MEEAKVSVCVGFSNASCKQAPVNVPLTVCDRNVGWLDGGREARFACWDGGVRLESWGFRQCRYQTCRRVDASLKVS